MHAIRRQAHRVASTTDNTGAANYNPFARARSHESALATLEHRRRLESRENDLDLIGPRRHDTAPISPIVEVPEPIPTTTTSNAFDESDATVVLSRISAAQELRSAIRSSWLNLLLPFIPAGFAVNYTKCSPATIFSMNFVAIIPTAALLSYAIEEVADRLGDTYGGLLSMTLGNTVQLIASILLLKQRQVVVLQTSLIGSILSNLLLMTGLSFVIGGFARLEQYFDPNIAQTIGMLLLLACLSIVVPTSSHLMANNTPEGILALSRGTSVIILMSYGLYVVFQYITNRTMYDQASEAVARKAKERPNRNLEKGTAHHGIAVIGAGSAATSGVRVGPPLPASMTKIEIEKIDQPQLSILGGLIVLVISVTLLGFNTQFATDNLQGLLEHSGLPAGFVGLVIVPVISSDPMSISEAWRDNMDASIALTLERCMQTALLVVPSVVLVAWGMGVDQMSLDFDGFTTAALFASIVIVTYVVQEGKSNWLTGALLIKVYIIIALASFYTN